MDKLGLEREVSSYEGLFKSLEKLSEVSTRLPMGDIRVAYILCELYAMMSAFQIRMCLGSADEIEIDSDCDEPRDSVDAGSKLPKYEAVQKAVRGLLAAIASEDKVGVATALEQMGVYSLCPILERNFPRMEVVAERFDGRTRLIPLVELSLFAVELGDYGRASKYAQESRVFHPASWELYNLCIVEGMIALSAGDHRVAVQQLDKSVRVCQTDEYTSLNCGARAPNLMLAKRLLELGKRVEVLRYLWDCHNVWQYLRPQIEEWIGVIEGGGRPDFEDTAVLRLNQLSYRLKTQWLSACSFDKGLVTDTSKLAIPKSPAAVLAGRERLRARQERRMDAAIKKQIEYLDE